VAPAEVYVGQKAELLIDVLTKTWFLQAPRYPDTLDVDDAIVLPPEAFGINFTERIDGQTYAGQTRKFTIFATAPGRLEISPVVVRLVVADESARPTSELELETPATTLEARIPEAARGLGLVVATPRFTVEESYSRSLDDLKLGESFSRTVTMTIEDSPAMLLPVLELTASEGVAVYSDRPSVRDRRNRGRLSGTRVESVTYLLEEEGPASLPEIVIRWWDLGASELREEVLPAVAFEVAPNPDLAPEHLGAPAEELELVETAAEEAGGPPWRLALVAAVAAVALWVVRRTLPRLRSRLAARRRERAESEAAYLAAFVKAARSRDGRLALSRLMAWLDRAEVGSGAATLRGFVEECGDEDLAEQLERLEAEVFSAEAGGPAWSPSHLVRGVKRARRRALRRAGEGRRGTRPGLGPLNPRPGA